MIKNRQAIEKLIYDVFKALDPSGVNTAKHIGMYSKMSDAQFEKHMRDFLKNDEENFILDINEMNRNIDLDKCEAAAKILGIPLAEYVYMPHLTMNKSRVVVSKQKCLVGWINIKRTQQLLHKKNGLSLSDDKRAHMTGQVIGDDKDARDSDIEATMLVSLGANNILKELHGPRADDVVMKREMMNDISNKGYTLLDDLTNSPTNKTTLNMVSNFFVAMGIHTDLVSDSYILTPILSDIEDAVQTSNK